MPSAPEIYKAMADESRLRIVHLLSRGYINVQELTSVLGLGQSTVSHHLKILQSAGIARVRKEGTWAYYTLAGENGAVLPSRIAQSFLELAKFKENGDFAKLLENDAHEAEQIVNHRRDKTQQYFDAVAGQWKEIRADAERQYSHLEDLAKLIPAEGSVLELGCGSGALFEHILPRKGETIGVDYSHAMLAEAKTALGDKAPLVDLRLGYLEHLPVTDASIDIAVAYMVFHHLSHPVDVLKDTLRVLKPGKRFVMVDLTRHNEEYMRERFGDLWLGFDPEELEKWAKEAGFQNVRSELLGKKKEVFLLSAEKAAEKKKTIFSSNRNV